MENSTNPDNGFQHKYDTYSSTPEAHTLETWTRTMASSTNSNLWIIYIHGGAWWRPDITSSSFALTINHLITSPLICHITGFASLNYRLSTPPPLPQFSHFIEPENPGRNIKHPTYLKDIISAMIYF